MTAIQRVINTLMERQTLVQGSQMTGKEDRLKELIWIKRELIQASGRKGTRLK